MDASLKERYINAAAYQYFRDVADGDYIMARSAFFMILMPQFFHSAQQAIEKYMKCILVLRRVDTKSFGHNLEKLLKKLDEFQDIFICESSKKFIIEINSIKTKYLETSYCIFGYECVFLDKLIWELRRYCDDKIHNNKEYKKFLSLDLNNKDIIIDIVKRSITGHDLSLSSGKLEKILENRDNLLRATLVRDNAFFGDIRKTTVNGIPYRFLFENTLLDTVNDEKIYDELCKYIEMPKREYLSIASQINNTVNSQRIENDIDPEIMGGIRQEMLSGMSTSAMIEERKKAYRNAI